VSVWPMMCWWLSPLADHSSFLCTGLASNDGATERAGVDRGEHSWSDASQAAIWCREKAVRCREKERGNAPSNGGVSISGFVTRS